MQTTFESPLSPLGRLFEEVPDEAKWEGGGGFEGLPGSLTGTECENLHRSALGHFPVSHLRVRGGASLAESAARSSTETT